MTQKVCSRCKKTKSLDDFAKAASRPDGHQYWCKECRKKHDARYYQDKQCPDELSSLQPQERS